MTRTIYNCSVVQKQVNRGIMLTRDNFFKQRGRGK